MAVGLEAASEKVSEGFPDEAEPAVADGLADAEGWPGGGF